MLKHEKTIFDRLNYVVDQLEDAIHQIDHDDVNGARDSVVFALEELREEE